VSPSSRTGTTQAPTLADGVVTIRKPALEDVEDLVQLCRDPQMVRWTSVPSPYEQMHAHAWLAMGRDGWVSKSRHQFVIEADGRLAGTLELRQEGAGMAEVGFGLAAWARGHGLMARALRLVIAWGFDEAGIDVVQWRAEVGNWASRRAAWAVGFKVYGTVPALLEHRGLRVDGWIGALHRGEPLTPAHTWLEPELVLGRDITLRAHREDDVPRIVDGCRDQQTAHWLSHLPRDYTAEDARDHLHRIRVDHANGQAVFWSVAAGTDDRMLGEVRLLLRDPLNGSSEIGYWTHPDARGRGVMTEAVMLAVRHALLPVQDGGLGLVTVALRAATTNVASQRVAQKAGFTRTGIDRSGERLGDGTLADVVRFDLLADELPMLR
jgi:ribosomal-protein-alanine N-acetyltransferase